MPQFCHLHCHTQYSLLDGAAEINTMMKKAVADGHPAVAITDHGNMFGAFKFWASAKKHGIKPILGCEVYVVEDHHQKAFTREKKDKRYHQLLLAKNATGYKNLCKICSTGFVDGYYGNFPRVSREIIKKYSEGIIATTCCLGSEVQQTILNEGEEAGEKCFKEWLDIFGDNYYIELQRHQIENIDRTGISQEDINQILIKWSRKYDVKMIATNDSHYVEHEDWDAHDALLCINSGSFKGIPIAESLKFRNTIQYRGKKEKERFGFKDGGQFYFKTVDEMARLFGDVPEALENTIMIADQVEHLDLKRDVLMPNFVVPPEFNNDQDEFLRHLSYEGARKRYPEITTEVRERLDLELKIIKDMGFPGYFLIVQDFIQAARDLGVAVGPGRGSAAGSAVAFCTGITNIDPIRYSLLFERFLNPERVSMPDIDIDFDDEGRQRVIDYVVEKYGQNQVAQIITYGTMASKSSIKDVARVMELDLSDANMLAKLVPDGSKNLKAAFKDEPTLGKYRNDNKSPFHEVLSLAETLEGSVRQRGIHAAGVIIAPDDIMEYIPVCTANEADLWVTQFDGKYIEDAGMLKMDFLGLRTLTIIKDAIENVHGRFSNAEIEKLTPNIINPETNVIDPDLVAERLDDELTYTQIFQAGATVGIFQFESAGMQKYLRQLRPTNIEDLIAMNALYRPGPMDNIPSFVNRKHGREKVTYPHDWLEPILKNTYGIMVYQEQIMQAAQIMAGFSLGQADLLRRAMGKKKLEEMQKQRIIFQDGAAAKGVDKKKADEIFDLMERFASYGFNRSHAAAYSVVAFQTAFLKAHYPAEFMAAVLTHNMHDIKKTNFFLNECNRMGLTTLVPDVNESNVKFTVNKKGEIRFAMAAIKGVGEAAVECLIEERKKSGAFKDLFDITKRVNLKTVNRRCLEGLAEAGAFDSFEGTHRAQYFYRDNADSPSAIEKAVKFGQSFQKGQANAQASLFGAALMDTVVQPEMPICEEWALMERLKKEKEMTGIYLSGHPLDNHKAAIDHFSNCTFEDIEKMKDKAVRIGGLVTMVESRYTKTGKPFAKIYMEDYSGNYDFMLWGEDYLKHKNFLEAGTAVFLTGEYAPNWKGNEYELKVNQVNLLSELLEKRAHKIRLQIELSDINDDLIATIHKLCEDHPGNMQLSFS